MGCNIILVRPVQNYFQFLQFSILSRFVCVFVLAYENITGSMRHAAIPVFHTDQSVVLSS